MSRKSRRNTSPAEPAMIPGAEVFPTAIYARLSLENSGKDDDGAAIANQIEVCKEHIAGCPDLQLVKIYEENGWTGTVMERPVFDGLMEDVRSGIIKAIVVRDLSRFARNYIEVGTYLERIFPRLGVRFISVKEQFDTSSNDGSNESLMIPLQNLINDLYARDISRKVETALQIQMANGSFAWRRLPYGYKWNDAHDNIVPDEVTAPVVRDMFRWYAEGLSKEQILKRLDEGGAPKYVDDEESRGRLWAGSTLYGTLSNPAYIGSRVVGRRHSAYYKGIHLEKRPESEWHVTENAHEALINPDIYEKVQERLHADSAKRQASMKKTQKAREKLVDLFEGKIFCADCGHKMYFHRHRMDKKGKPWYANYYCSYYQLKRGTGCTYHNIRQKVLEEKVLEAIRMQAAVALDMETLISKFKDSEKDRSLRDAMNAKIRSLSYKLNAVQARRTKLYEDYADGILDEAEYMYAKETFNADHDKLNKELDGLVMRRDEYREAISSENKWVRLMKGVRTARRLTQELVDSVIESVRVYEGGGIELVMKYQDVFELTEKYVKDSNGRSRKDGG